MDTLHDKAAALNKEVLRIKAKAQRLEKFRLQLIGVTFNNNQLLIQTEMELEEVLKEIEK